MAIKLTTAVRNGMADSLISAIGTGTTNAGGTIRIFDGSQPSGPEVAVTTQVQLSEHLMTEPCGTSANGVLTFASIADDDFADATGVATWARFYNRDGAAVADASISQVGGGGDLQMNTTNIVINGPIRFTSLQWTMPGG